MSFNIGFPDVSLATVMLGTVVAMALAVHVKMAFRSRAHLVEKPPEITFKPRAYTVEELAEYDGRTKPFAFVGVKGVIYNASMDWYGPEGSYNAFAGRDSSRSLGKMMVSRDEENADWTRLSPEHLHTLNEWEERLRSKYAVVGWISDPRKEFTRRAASFDP